MNFFSVIEPLRREQGFFMLYREFKVMDTVSDKIIQVDIVAKSLLD